MSRAALPATVAAVLTCLALAACQNEPAPVIAGGGLGSVFGGGGGIGGGVGQTDAATRAACTQHAEDVYNQRNRGEIYTPQSSVNTPFSANYNPGVTTRGLSDRYARDSMIRDCVRNTGTETSRDVPPPPATGAVVRP